MTHQRQPLSERRLVELLYNYLEEFSTATASAVSPIAPCAPHTRHGGGHSFELLLTYNCAG